MSIPKGEAHTELIAKLDEIKTSGDTSKITQGEATVTGGGDGLQQVLLYGKNGSNGNLEPLETVGDRLLVDVIELSPTGPYTPTSLPSVAIYGQVDTTSGFKNLRVDSNGRLQITNNLSTRSSSNDIVTGATVGANLQIGSDIDIGTDKTIIIVGSATGNHAINIEHSTNNTDWFVYAEVSPVAHNALYHFNIKIEDGLQYYRIINDNTSNTFTLKYVTL